MTRSFLLSLTVVSCSLLAAATCLAETATGTVRQGPQRLSPADHGVGRLVADAAFNDLDGRVHRLSEFRATKGVVVAVTSTSCPLSKKYLPTLAALEQQYAKRGVAFVYINPLATDSEVSIREAIKTNGLSGAYVHDAQSPLLAALAATTTTECFVLDRARTLIYRGAVDDQYGFGYSIDNPRERYLAAALDALLDGNDLAVAATSAPGCVLGFSTQPPEASTAVTYHNRISRIVQQHCVRCHRDGGAAPFALTSYDDVVAHAGMIRQVIERGVMPPWFAAPGATEKASPWSNDPSLGKSERADLLAWLDGSRPVGDAADAPLPLQFVSDWQIGKPDAVLQFDKPFSVKATGVMPYQNAIVETNFDEDRWIQALEVRPSAPQVVHHVVVSIVGFRRGDSSTSESSTDDGSDERRGFFAVYVPGTSTLVYPTGYARRLPKGARLRFQMHYTPNGTAVDDLTRLGLIFSKEPPQHEVLAAGVINTRLNIPAGANNHHEVAELRLPADVQVLAFQPHMHLRGKAARYSMVNSDGKEQVLLDVPRYDFNWQLLYRYAEPVTLTRGTTLRFTAWYDNSTENPANPDATKNVRWGQQTFEEMQVGFVEYIIPGMKPGERRGLVDLRSGAGSRPGVLTGANLEATFRRLDKDGNGKLDRQEFTFSELFNRLDKNDDGTVTLDEARAIVPLLQRRAQDE